MVSSNRDCPPPGQTPEQMRESRKNSIVREALGKWIEEHPDATGEHTKMILEGIKIGVEVAESRLSKNTVVYR